METNKVCKFWRINLGNMKFSSWERKNLLFSRKAYRTSGILILFLFFFFFFLRRKSVSYLVFLVLCLYVRIRCVRFTLFNFSPLHSISTSTRVKQKPVNKRPRCQFHRFLSTLRPPFVTNLLLYSFTSKTNDRRNFVVKRNSLSRNERIESAMRRA